MRPLLTRKEIERSIFDGTYPTRIFKIQNLNFIYVISERTFPTTLDGWLTFFSHAIVIPGVEDSYEILSNLPLHLFYCLIQGYKLFYRDWFESISHHILIIVRDSRSRTTWSVCQHTSIDKVIPVHERLNTAQYFWVALNANTSVEQRNKMIHDIFEMLQPWLNMELWQHLRKNDDNDETTSTRVNRNEEQDLQEYLSSIPEEDVDEISVG
jgi:hypothetical protein